MRLGRKEQGAVNTRDCLMIYFISPLIEYHNTTAILLIQNTFITHASPDRFSINKIQLT